ncbi:hypothetical protein HNR26_002344 [Rhizobium rosettiformans]|uniref:Uncharacterized protein n=2 Tax=Rhizobium rosettiformans TaxID=1368430 RepID=A0A4S8PYV5_9HYPH|nr:hypothetical protein [Rhizobium rosettiformans]MBB5276292.1 hypothetical protein [Rhizobium rosettiformans]THV36923.1 hypothetical protein FAA86_10535 [Rhizobium rosettiformans W3]
MTKEFTDLQGLAVGQVWQHKNGNCYEIYDFTNLEAGRQDEYPTTVSYRNIHTGAPYSRKVSRWAGSFTRREDLEKNNELTILVSALVGGETVTRSYQLKGLRAACIDQAKAKFAEELGEVDRWVFINTTGKTVHKIEKVVSNG